LAEGWPEQDYSRSVTVAFVREDEPLRPGDAEAVRALQRWVEENGPEGAFGTVLTHLDNEQLESRLASDDGHAWLMVVRMEVAPNSPEGVAALRELREAAHAVDGPPGLERYVTGAPAVAIDEHDAVRSSVQRTRALSIGLVVVLLLVILRSLVAALIPLLTVGTAYAAALGAASALGAAGLEVSHLFETFAIVIIFGAGTDYSLMLTTRFREELGAGSDGDAAPPSLWRRRRLTATLAVLLGVLASAAASTIVGFSAQSVAEFGLFRTMGPSLAAAVAITLLAGLTLTPALMRAAGPALFWPRRPAGEAGGSP
jgi:RND superfamily putative drug exporter